MIQYKTVLVYLPPQCDSSLRKVLLFSSNKPIGPVFYPTRTCCLSGVSVPNFTVVYQGCCCCHGVDVYILLGLCGGSNRSRSARKQLFDRRAERVYSPSLNLQVITVAFEAKCLQLSVSNYFPESPVPPFKSAMIYQQSAWALVYAFGSRRHLLFTPY